MRVPGGVLPAGASVLGVALLIGGIIADGHIESDDLQRFGLTTLILVALVYATRRRDGMIEAARQRGYDDGYADGCEVRPQVIPIGSARLESPTLGAAKQLSQQGNVRG